ncbi:hypothetical protein D3C80_1637450 [compost metagenome]
MLAQGAGAADRTAAFVVGKGGLYGAKVKAPVLGKLLVFAGHDRDLQVVGDVVPRLPVTLQVNGLAIEPGFDLALDHQRGPRWRDKTEHQHQQYAAAHEPEQDFREALEKYTQHRDGLAEPVEPAIIQTLPDESDWSSSCCVAF